MGPDFLDKQYFLFIYPNQLLGYPAFSDNYEIFGLSDNAHEISNRTISILPDIRNDFPVGKSSNSGKDFLDMQYMKIRTAPEGQKSPNPPDPDPFHCKFSANTLR